MGYLPTMVDPTVGMIIFISFDGSPSVLHIPTSFLYIIYTHIPDDFRMGISEIIALMAFIAPQFILLYMWTYF